MNKPIGLRPDYYGARAEYTATASRNFWRLMTANVIGAIRDVPTADVITAAWGREEREKLITKASTNITSSSGAEFLPITAVGSLPILAPRSAAAVLAEKCLSLNFDGINQVMVPSISTAPTGQWTGEGSPMSMVQPAAASLLVGPPRKLAFGAAVTAEVANYSADIAMPIIKATILRAAVLALDAALLDATAADATRPAGLLNGVSDSGPQAGGGLTALTTDLGKLAGAIAAGKIFAEDLILLMDPAAAIRARGLLSPAFQQTYTIVGSSAVTSGVIIAVAPSGVATFFGAPTLEVSKDGLVMLDDSSPRDIDTTAVAATVKSAWQSNLVLLKLRLRCTWAPLASAAVQKIVAISW
jgi:hypothetical protein